MNSREYYAMAFAEIERDGKEELLEWMDKNGFFEAPASAGHHLNCKGGLAQHSINVERRLEELAGDDIPEESVTICGLLHDICKIDEYKLKVNGYEYERNPEAFPMGHGEKSVELIQRFMKLTDAEKLAIRWHMGAWDDAVRGGCRDMNRAYEFSKLVPALHIADMMASQLDED